MNRILRIFKYLAYLQLLFMFGALYIIYEPIITRTAFEEGGKEVFIKAVSTALILIGFGLSLVSLRDHSKIDKMGRWIIEKPKIFKVFIYISIFFSLAALMVGTIFLMKDFETDRLAIGLCSFGIGFLSLIKSFIDQAKNLTEHY